MKHHLLCASALCGSLVLAQPAQAACTTSTEAPKTVVCTGDIASTVALGSGVDGFTNDGDIAVSLGLAVTAGTNMGDFTNNGTITSTSNQIYSVKIDGFRDGAVLSNSGTISTGSNGGAAIAIGGNATVRNSGSIVTLPGSGNSTGVLIEGGGDITNLAGGEIRGGLAGVRTTDRTRLVNAGAISGINGALLGNRSSVDNSGTITGSSNAVAITADGTVINREGGELIGTAIAPAVMLQSGSNAITNAGRIDTTGTSAGSLVNVIILRSSADKTSMLTNAASGVIGHAGIAFGSNAVLGTGGGALSIANAGTIHGGLDLSGSTAARTVLNGYDQAGNPVAGPARIEGSLSFGDGDDIVRNKGAIVGDIFLGAGTNELVNHGTIEGNILDADGVNHIVLAGTLNGNGQFSGTTTLEVSGVLNGSIVLG